MDQFLLYPCKVLRMRTYNRVSVPHSTALDCRKQTHPPDFPSNSPLFPGTIPTRDPDHPLEKRGINRQLQQGTEIFRRQKLIYQRENSSSGQSITRQLLFLDSPVIVHLQPFLIQSSRLYTIQQVICLHSDAKIKSTVLHSYYVARNFFVGT